MIQALNLHIQPYLPLVPLLTPAINRETYQLDDSLLGKRIKCVASVCIAATVVTLFYCPVIALVGLLWMPIAVLDKKLSNLAIDKLAVREYLDVVNPSQKCFDRIGSNVNALRSLIEQTDNFYKCTTDGIDLFRYCRDLETFKFYVDNNFDFAREDHHIYGYVGRFPDHNFNFTYLQRVVMHMDHTFLHYLVHSGRIAPENFTSEHQFRIWSSLSQVHMAPLLVQAGFNINVRSQFDPTPLQSLLLSDDILRRLSSLSFEDHVRALLDNGADPHLTVMHERREKNALELASGYPEIQAIIRERMHP